MKLTIYHDGQFWVGVAEQAIDGKVRAVQHIFGPEPHDEEVLKFVNQQLFQLFNQANAIIAAPMSIIAGQTLISGSHPGDFISFSTPG